MYIVALIADIRYQSRVRVSDESFLDLVHLPQQFDYLHARCLSFSIISRVYSSLDVFDACEEVLRLWIDPGELVAPLWILRSAELMFSRDGEDK